MAESKAPVSSRAIVQRINRVLAKQDEKLLAARGARAKQELGDFYIIDGRANVLVERDVTLEEKARELGVLRPYERLED